MANTIVLKRSATPGKVPTTAQLALGEIAINTYDGLIYIKKDNGTASIAQIGGVTSVNGETGSITISSDDISDAGQTNKWFANSLARGAITAGSGISYNSGTGVISTTQTLTTAGTPQFAGLTLTGNMGITGNIIPSADVTYDLGSLSYQWRDVYVGPGSLYVNGQKVLQDDSGTITFSADMDENIRIKTLGTGILQLGSSTSNLQIDGTLTMASGKRITDAAGTNVQFGNPIHMNSNKITNVGAPSAGSDAATKTYVDTAIGNISTNSVESGNSNITVTDTGTGTVTVTVDGSTALTVDATGVVVAGNFTVSGTTTTVNSNTVAIADNILTLNSDAVGAPTSNAGIEVERGDEANVQLRWNEGSDTWTFTNNGAVYYPVPTGTDDLAEGSTNQYFTQSRARNSVSSTSATGVSYNSSTGVISLSSIPNSALTNNSITINGTAVALGGTRTLDTDSVSEGTNKYFSNTLARGAFSFSAGSGAYNSSTGAITIPTNTSHLTNGANFATESFVTSAVAGKDNTDELTEGSTNRFFTDGRARAAVSAGTGISYNSTTGVITNTITQYTDALARGAVSFSAGSGAYNSTTGVFSIPTNTNQLTNGAGFATEAFVTSAVAGKDNTDEITEGSTNRFFTDARARAAVSFTAGSGAYNSTTGVFSIPTNTNQLTNGAGYITGITSGNVTSALGFTPYNATNPNGYVSSSGVTSVATSNGISGGTITSTGTLSLSGSYTGTWAVTGGITATGEVTAYYSDDRLKKDVTPITDPIAKLMAIRGVTFRPNATALALGITDKDEVGVIAQAVQAVLPQLVTGSAYEGYITVKYEKLTALLIEAVREQQQQIDDLKALVNRLAGGL
jgi:hypothetical protein